jgi:hypothetical protein
VSPGRALRRARPPLLAALLLAAQLTALAHEPAHVAGEHDEPCAPHVLAEHLAMASAPAPAPPVAWRPAIAAERAAPGIAPAPPLAPRGARAPPPRA